MDYFRPQPPPELEFDTDTPRRPVFDPGVSVVSSAHAAAGFFGGLAVAPSLAQLQGRDGAKSIEPVAADLAQGTFWI